MGSDRRTGQHSAARLDEARGGQGAGAASAVLKGRAAIILSGAAGVPLAAPLYILAIVVGSPLIALPREAEPVMFVVLLAAALIEMPLMVFALRTLRRQGTSLAMLHGLNVVYVSFAGVYAALQVLLFGESVFSEVLLGLTFVRWLSDWLIAI